MKKINNIIRYLFYCFFIASMFAASAYPQSSSIGLAPKAEIPLSPYVRRIDNINNFNTRAFGYNAYGFAAPLGPFKMFLNSPVLTNLAPDPYSANYIAGASFAADGILYGVRFGSNLLVEIDTSNGTITTIGYSGPGTGMAYDWTTNTMYMMTYNTAARLNTVNLSTGMLTPIGQFFQDKIADISCSNTGQLYGIDIDNDCLVSIDKQTGMVTIIGYMGFDANYSQGMSWDHSTDSCFYASYNNVTNQCEMRRVNLQTGETAMMYSIDAEVDGLAIPGAPGPQILHTPLHDTENVTGPYNVNAVIIPRGSPIVPSQIKVYWSRNNTSVTDSITMTNINGNNWIANIPGNGTAAVYRYYITAKDEFGTIRTVPVSAPDSFYLFRTGADTIKPSISHSHLYDLPEYSWPPAVSCIVTDNIGIDSVWVWWFRNDGATGTKQFKLNNNGGYNFSAAFNSDTSEVQVNDSIFYRIFAQDVSSNHNKDSTVLYKFKIINPPQLCYSPGSASIDYPFLTNCRNVRTQMLWTAEELHSVQTITKISFNFLSFSSVRMTDFNVKMQNTTDDSISSTVTSGWVPVYSGSYSVPGLGWQGIVMQTPFMRDVSKNLLVEICFQDSFYLQPSKVASEIAPGKIWVVLFLGSGYVGCSLTGNSVFSNKRPVVCFDYLIGVSDTGRSLVPSGFSLSQNYPNPFNPSTTIRYSIPELSRVRLIVYDLLGKKVAVLIDETKTAGRYSVEFDASHLASGVYFYQIEAVSHDKENEFKQAKKLLLLK